MATQTNDSKKAVNGKELLETVWTEESRPSQQWLWMHSGKEIPAKKIGGRFIYNPDKVREALGL